MMKSARAVLLMLSLVTLGTAFAAQETKNYIGKVLPPVGVDSWFFNKPDLKNKWVLLEFFEPWCPHCERISGDINRLYKNNRSWLEVIAISQDMNTTDDLFEYPDYTKPSHPMAHRDPKSPRIGINNGVPYGLIINQCGIVVWQDSLAVVNSQDKEVAYIEQADLDELRKQFGKTKCENKNHLLFPMAKAK
jgi:cytochrome c biogenesis protein CcmG, thiol:disulfide interchange protein DsbE